MSIAEGQMRRGAANLCDLSSERRRLRVHGSIAGEADKGLASLQNGAGGSRGSGENTLCMKAVRESYSCFTPGTYGSHDRGEPDRPRQSSHIYIAEPSKDFLQIPAHRTTSDTVLNWEVFEGRWTPMALVGVLFTPTQGETAHDVDLDNGSFAISGGLMPPDEEQIPVLVDKFLQNVHTKNPVLDVEQLVKQARRIANRGLGWDGWSCLVLLACALGTIAKPFDAAVTYTTNPTLETGPIIQWKTDAPTTPRELQQAEAYFALACRRMGSLKYSILGSQCFFFAGVYLMYTLRPLLSWQYFTQASNMYQLYIKTTHGLAADISQLGQIPIHHLDILDSKRRRLEESMYWSCFKSESEFRVELPLPQTEISNYTHPQMFPSPPSPAGLERSDNQAMPNLVKTLSNDSALGRMPGSIVMDTNGDEDFELRQHAKKLCNEEESWYYYLTEIALRRIGNRIINTFFSQSRVAWLDPRPLLGIALEFDTQVSAWSAHLPAAMQHWETNYTIRAPALDWFPDGNGNPVSRELSWATDNRLLEMRSWLYQPFLYYFIHRQAPLKASRGSTNNSHGTPYQVPSCDEFISATCDGHSELNVEDSTALYHFITSGIECNAKILDVRSLRHRHHGLWYDLRSLMTAGLILLAIVKSGHEAWIPGGVQGLWGFSTHAHPCRDPIEGKLGHVLAEFEFWSEESPDFTRHRDVLEEVTRMVQRAWFERRNV
ncbi:hypothetical protein LTR37_003035 [Vermiconidia calcicola]|uniref:Uncharacterized protein n=1 Tax=Vermiconidia calcicola TaxID=1690605 RepID=A0ACC3NTL1_9PEZI|nr:hypothetical protein LTR37_003035 [Vermiconidia calcicola]